MFTATVPTLAAQAALKHRSAQAWRPMPKGNKENERNRTEQNHGNHVQKGILPVYTESGVWFRPMPQVKSIGQLALPSQMFGRYCIHV